MHDNVAVTDFVVSGGKFYCRTLAETDAAE
jgi:hypothetical protein